MTNEHFGTPEEAAAYADGVVAALVDETSLGFEQVYFPLVLGGLIANTRITMPREQTRETVFVLSKALDNRRGERREDNNFVFDIADSSSRRARYDRLSPCAGDDTMSEPIGPTSRAFLACGAHRPGGVKATLMCFQRESDSSPPVLGVNLHHTVVSLLAVGPAGALPFWTTH